MDDPELERLNEATAEYERRLAEFEQELGPHEKWDPAVYARISRQLLIETGLKDATDALMGRASARED